MTHSIIHILLFNEVAPQWGLYRLVLNVARPAGGA
jgi:hypothetical protein